MVTRRDIHQQVDGEQANKRDLGTFEQHVARTERRVSNRGRKVAGGVRRGVRYVGKHRKKLKKRPVRTVAGMAGRSAVVVTVGAAHTTGYAVKKAGQGYRAARPRVAGASMTVRRRAYAYATVYGGPAGQRAAETGRRAADSASQASRRLKSQSTRVNARVRTRRRRVAGRMQHRAELYRKQGKTRLAQVVEATAGGLAPKRRVAVRCACGATFHNRARAAQHVCHDAIRSENAAIQRARQWTPTAGPTAGNTPARNSIATPTPPRPGAGNPTTTSGGVAMTAKNKAASTPTSGFEPRDYEEWMAFLHGKAAFHKQEAEGLQELAERMDNDEGMDPRSLMPLYMGAESEQIVSQGYIQAYAKFWALYQDRLEQQGDTGRRMNNEDGFFGQKK